MNDDLDIEKSLKNFRHDAATSKRAVMSEFDKTRSAARAQTVRFWRRPIPLYAAAALLVAAIGLSFAAGQQTAREAPGHLTEQPAEADAVVTSQDIEWNDAVSDFL